MYMYNMCMWMRTRMYVCVWTICTDVKLPSVCFVLLLLVQQDFLAMYAGGQ